jgi:hypothetical protein
MTESIRRRVEKLQRMMDITPGAEFCKAMSIALSPEHPKCKEVRDALAQIGTYISDDDARLC